MLYPLLIVCGAVLLFVYIREKIKAYSVKAVLLKSIVSVLFIMVGVYGAWLSASKGNASLLCPFAVLGLLCGLLGDIWLDLKYVFPEKDEPFTYAGFCVFGIGHILYIVGMLLSYYPAGRPMTVIVPVLLALVLSIGNAVLEKPMKLNYGEVQAGCDRLRCDSVRHGDDFRQPYAQLWLEGAAAEPFLYRRCVLCDLRSDP